VGIARTLLKKFPNKADILNTSYKKNCSLISHTDSLVLVLSGSVDAVEGEVVNLVAPL